MAFVKKYPTLGELFVLLVVIGLIAGGLLFGRQLIMSAELQSIIADEQHNIYIVGQFRLKYKQLPGDMTDATRYWGKDPCGCPCLHPRAEDYVIGKTETCDGNGNGLIENDGEGGDAQHNAMFENFRAWQQLADAGFFEKRFTGVQGADGYADMVPGRNTGPSSWRGAGFEWAVLQVPYAYGEWYVKKFPTMQYQRQYLMFGTVGTQPFDLWARTLTPAQAQAIDRKMDDGLPLSGIVLGSRNRNGKGSCLSDGSVVRYDLATGIPFCTLLFDTHF